MTRDPIVDEVRRIREEHAARYGYDLDRIFDALLEDERRAGVQTVSLTPKVPAATSTHPATRTASAAEPSLSCNNP